MMGTTHTPPVVVVGIDGSAGSDSGVRWAESYAEATGGSLRIVVGWEWPVAYGYPRSFEGLAPDMDARRVAEKAAAGLHLPPERIEIRICEGLAGDVLVDASKDADLLVVGSHGHRGITTGLLGSVGTHCLHAAWVPVVVVR